MCRLGSALFRWISQLLFSKWSKLPGPDIYGCDLVTSDHPHPGPGLRCHGGHYPFSPDRGQPGNIRLWFCHKSKVHICGTFRSWLEVYCIQMQLTIPYSLDEELWFIHPHQFWTWKISDDTRLLFNCTGSGDKKSSWLIIIRLTTENWKWLFVSLA